MARARIGRMLALEGLVDERQLTLALDRQRRLGGRLGRALVDLGMVSEPELLGVLARQLGVPVVRLGAATIQRSVIARVPKDLIRSCRALPLDVQREGRREVLVVAFASPEDLPRVDEIAFAAGMQVRPMLAGERDLQDAISRHLDRPAARSGRTELDAVDIPPASDGPMVMSDGRVIDS